MKVGGFAGWIASLTLVFTAFAAGAQADNSGPTAGWDAWGNTAGGLRYSPLNQITPQNVGRLKVAWTYHFGPSATQSKVPLFTLEVTPWLVKSPRQLARTAEPGTTWLPLSDLAGAALPSPVRKLLRSVSASSGTGAEPRALAPRR